MGSIGSGGISPARPLRFRWEFVFSSAIDGPAYGEVVLESPERHDDTDDEARRGDQKQPESEPESLVDSP